MLQTSHTRTLLLSLAMLAIGSSVHAATQAEIDAYNTAADAHNNRVERYDSAAAAFNNERASYQSAVAHYNSLSPDQRTQFQRDRLDRWHRNLQGRLQQLNAELTSINARARYLAEWYDRLNG